MKRFWQYMKDVESGKILTNVYVKQAMARFRADVEKSKDPDYPYTFDEEKAARFIKFSECLKLYQDEFKGKPLQMMPWQVWAMGNIYGWVRKDNGKRRFRKAFLFVSRKSGKDLDLNTVLHTPDGDRRLEDIHPGDYVFGSDGMPTRVVAESEIFTDHKCYNVSFKNGDVITAGEGHLWSIKGTYGVDKLPCLRTYTTGELYSRMRSIKLKAYAAHPFRVPLVQPLQYPDNPNLFNPDVPVRQVEHHDRNRWNTILSITPVETVKTKCIQVENPDGLFAVGKHNTLTHNSSLCATTLLYDLLITPGAQGYCCATKREQSKIVWTACKEMIRQNEGLSKRIKVYNSASRLVCDKTSGYIEAMSSEADKMDGLSPSCAVIDEVAAQKNFNLIKVLQSGQGARPEPLLFEITSGSDDQYSAGALEFERSTKILNGTIEDDTFFCVLYCLDKNDDWKDNRNDIKACPSLGYTVQQEFIDNLRKEALQQPSLEMEFRSKLLGQFVSPVTSWIDGQTWQRAIKAAKKSQFDPDACPVPPIGAVDLSQRSDFTAYTLCFYSPEDNAFHMKHRFYFPENQIDKKMKQDSPMIRHWIDGELITPTNGDLVDYNVMFEDIKADCEKYHTRCILFDAWNSSTLVNQIGPIIDLVEITQNMRNISPFAKEYYNLILEDRLADDNPVVAWMISNCDLYKDQNENWKPVKHGGKDSSNRIDGVITSLMAAGYFKQLLDNGDIDTRTEEEQQASLEAFFNSCEW